MDVLATVLTERYRCPAQLLAVQSQIRPAHSKGFFRFGPDLVCYGHSVGAKSRLEASAQLRDVAEDIVTEGSEVGFPFDPGGY